MEEEAPQPDDPARDHTAALHKRPRSDSGSSTSAEESILSLESTRTLESDELEFVDENGRTYGNDTYYMPCDQAEQDRLTIQHQVFLYALKGKLTTTKITSQTKRILDLGTGPGHWAVAMAQLAPHAEVVGVDLAVWDLETTEEDQGGARVTWEIDDLDVWGVEADTDELTHMLEQYDPFGDPAARNPMDSAAKPKDKQPQTQPQTPSTSEPTFIPYELPELQLGWHFSKPFDLIHVRNLKGSFAYWEDVYAEMYKNLNPGGWVELCDYELVMPAINLTPAPLDEASKTHMDEDMPFPAIRRLYLSMMQASFKSGRPAGSFYLHQSYLEDAGFKDVKTTYVNVPVGTWPADEQQKRIGKMFLVVIIESLEAHSLRLLTTFGDAEKVWTADEVREMTEMGKLELLEWSDGIGSQENKEGWCANFKWVVGRKSKNA